MVCTQVAIATARGCVRRCFTAWLLLSRERWWKSQLSSMESQVAVMEAKLRGYEKRPIQVSGWRPAAAVPTARLRQSMALWSALGGPLRNT
jgi:hypothetical protein